MEWIIKIENKPNQRILVRFNPLNEELIFIGQFRTGGNEWNDFNVEIISMNVELPQIQEAIFKIAEIMQKRIDAYNNLAEGFSIIKVVEITEE